MKVRIDKDRCTGEGICQDTCPEIFRLNEETDLAEVIKTDYDENDMECIREASESCPSEAIIIEE